jgi:hypothetical protein
VRPSPPTEKAIGAAVAQLANEAKLVTPLEISALRPNDHGPGSFFVCVREVNPPPDKPRRYYSTFLDNNDYKGSRLSVIMDQCEFRHTVLHLSLRLRSLLLRRMPRLLSTSAARRNDDWLSRFSRTSQLAPHP